ncbi:hypothetical protein [Thiorhodovibrio frisius]|uniref:Uncharacterized protein n=1 Tax=Thiorhodovibrio frisius TaxID=631362 RepID=H8YVW5_9GAMM|nr:hypothetical protein [Thiorhodovibrio frisius]EIC23756.1 hypothetical protein Thi970DRAFT_00261 [Thiorhodovibrio frisius]WPL20165.1 hypothetical protein Thiofri_00229 [Thiorhodovibrio frisius]
MTQPLLERRTPTAQPPGAPIGHQGNILHFDRDWQYPAQTERHAFRQLARLGQVPDGITYIAYPWANLIDKVDTKAADADAHLHDFQAFRQQIGSDLSAGRLRDLLQGLRARMQASALPKRSESETRWLWQWDAHGASPAACRQCRNSTRS